MHVLKEFIASIKIYEIASIQNNLILMQFSMENRHTKWKDALQFTFYLQIIA